MKINDKKKAGHLRTLNRQRRLIQFIRERSPALLLTGGEIDFRTLGKLAILQGGLLGRGIAVGDADNQLRRAWLRRRYYESNESTDQFRTSRQG